HEGDARARPVGPAGALQIVEHREDLGALAAEPVERLVAPADAIDEALALRLGGEPRPAAEEALGRFGREAARGGDVAGDLAVERPEKALELLLVRFREAALDEVVE